MEQDYLKLTIPDKPRSKKQKYHTMLSGRSVIKATGEKRRSKTYEKPDSCFQRNDDVPIF